MNKKKIFNDPVYGFVNIPYEILFDLIEHPYFQRLRRIKQLGLTDYVYPGAGHTRFHHALGALHLMTQAIESLRSKGVNITDAEAKGASIAILLHDIGHGPFSHALEHSLVEVHHEELSLLFMEVLNKEFNGALQMAIDIFTNKYPKKFLHQLISGQLDMDRLDYLGRDSFFTGVHEGVVGHDRIIKMLAVRNDELVVEEKGIYSIEKFLMARRLMYWQVYLHKTVVAAEQMLIKVMQRAKFLAQEGVTFAVPDSLKYCLQSALSKDTYHQKPTELLNNFARLDDYDIFAALKAFSNTDDLFLVFLSKALLNRKLFKVELQSKPFEEVYVQEIRQSIIDKLPISRFSADNFLIRGKETNSAYNTSKEEIKILYKNGKVLPMSEISDFGIKAEIITKYYLCYPKDTAYT